MVQVIPVIQRARCTAEEMQDAFNEAAADGVIDSAELSKLAPIVTLTVVRIEEAGDCQVAAMAVLKGGVGAHRANDLLNQLDARHGY